MVTFYDGLQKISMRYLLPLMSFDSIRLAFGYEGLCPPGLGTACYSAVASAWINVVPRLLPMKEPLVESATFSVSVQSNNGFDLLWRTLELAVPGFKSMNPGHIWMSSRFAGNTSYTFGSSLSTTCSSVLVRKPTSSCIISSCQSMRMWLPPFNLRSMLTSPMTMKGISRRICASMASQLQYT